VTDKDGAVMARRLAREEGILLGYSAGSAVAGLIQLKDQLTPEDIVVVVIHDHGSRYVGKIYNDDWMRERGFLDTELRVKDLIQHKREKGFIGVEASATVRDAFHIMKEKEISQMPVLREGQIVGSLTESAVLNFLLENPMKHTEQLVETIMGEPFPEVNADQPVSQLRMYINKQIPAVVARDKAGEQHIITQYDIIQAV
jgi:cystathionine beta-synthase